MGRSGLTVSTVGLGCYTFGNPLRTTQARRIVDAAIDAGVTLMDTADIYGRSHSEQILSAALAGRRDKVVLATKFGQALDLGYGPAAGAKGGRAYIRRAVEHSLRRLNTDYIDLYQIHIPDPSTPIAETLSALDDLVHDGKIRYVGLSNFRAWQVTEAVYEAGPANRAAPVSVQDHWSILERAAEADLVPAARHLGLGVIAYFPLANGLLTGKVSRTRPPEPGTRLAAHPHWLTAERLARVEKLEAWAAQRGVALLEVALGGLLARPGCGSVITGATSASQITANAAAGGWLPSAGELADLDSIVPLTPQQP